MRFISVATAVAAVLLVVAVAAASPRRDSVMTPAKIAVKGPIEIPARWADLFAPPFAGPPTIMMAITCIDRDTCYVPGGENGVGFDIFRFDGRPGGRFVPMNMPAPPMMILAASMGGTAADPKGAVGGIGIGNGVQYPVNSTTFVKSYVPSLMVVSQDIRSSAGGKQVLVVDSASSNVVLTSMNGGASFKEHPIKSPMPQCASGRYGSIVSEDVFFISLGSWPDNNNAKMKASSAHFPLSESISVKRSTSGKITRERKFLMGAAAKTAHRSEMVCNGYTAVIAKTTDGGATFTTVFSAATNFYFNAIDCFDEHHCVAVAEGFDADAGVRVFLTENGANFTQVLFVPSTNTSQYSFMSVRFVSATEAWIGGSRAASQLKSDGVFFRSINGGKTWNPFDHGINDVVEISDVSFTPDGTGFATAMTVMDDSTILRYKHNRAPLPSFSEKQCPIAGCSLLCEVETFPQGACLSVNGGGSAIATCDAAETTLLQKFYNSSSCTGPFTLDKIPTNQCLKSDSGNYFEVLCVKPKASSRDAKVLRRL